VVLYLCSPGAAFHHRNCIAGGRRCSRVSLDFNCGEIEGLTC
jgi:hypothetical protein